jgi:N-acetyl sugar amidotransferase
MPTTRPDTEFVDGVCSACLSFDKRATIDWEARKRDFADILFRMPVNHSGYDCILASSGGKDSHWQARQLIDLGAKPLVVTAHTCLLTDIGRRNIDNLRRHADTIVVEYDADVRRRLNILGQELVGDISWPEHVAIFSAPFRIAAQLGIKTIFYGENPQEAYGGPLGSETAEELTKRWITEFGGHLGLRSSDMVGKRDLTEADMSHYMLPSDERLAGIQAYFMGAFFPWDSHRNWEVAFEMGMVAPASGPCEANWWQAENLDNAMTGLHDFGGWVKYGYGRACAQASVDVRYGILTREDALYVVQRRDGIFPSTYMGVSVGDVLDHLGASYDWLIQSFRRFTNKALFTGEGPQERLILKEFANGRDAADGGLQPSDAAQGGHEHGDRHQGDRAR